ncbi:serine hydrolase [Granulicella sp. S156]|jgi:CubicO group peptidase (beta-lactamase class C family)|uniref:serine hydrolase domain-containing protein n=1 Tax=Granulicella sp. S156 TaxID=1747224 RepID=UPI00131B8E46|nr:serine hydrolase domain-containing protein [Granulicella sp. S156]
MLFFLVLAAAVVAPDLHVLAQTPTDDRRQVIPALLHREHVASVSFAKIAGAKTVLAEAYGEQGPGVAVSTATLYNIASMSKPISAEVILRLASAGRLSLDEPMYKYWDDPDVATDPRAKMLTPRLALDHQTGFANWRRETGGKLAFTRAPGTGFGYSGEGYQYVARFAEKKTGKPFESLAQDLIFDPSGMTRTSYTQRPWMEGNIAQPTDKDGQWLKPQVATQFVAADLVYTNPTQYASFVESLMRGAGETAAIRKLRESVLTDRKADLCVGKLAKACPDEVGFGPGWEVVKTHGKTFLMHTGIDEGVFTLGYFDPGSRAGVIIFTNSSNGPRVILPILKLLDADPDFIAYLEAQV